MNLEALRYLKYLFRNFIIKSAFEYLCMFLWTTPGWLRRLGGQLVMR